MRALRNLAFLLAAATACARSGANTGVDGGAPGEDGGEVLDSGADAGPEDAGPDGGPGDAGGSPDGGPDAGPPSDAGPPGDGGGDAGPCVPGACDDGLGASKCHAAPSGTGARYHLSVTGAGFADIGVCLYVVNPTGAVRGDVVVHGGGGGTSPEGTFNTAFTAAGFRVTDVAWDSDWELTGTGYPGSILVAAGRVRAVLDWTYAFIRTGNGAFCGHGYSGGTGAMLYAITHYGEGDSKLDHVQLMAGTPFGRIDQGCDPSVVPMATTLCPDIQNLAQPYPGWALGWIRTWTEDPSCALSPSAASLQAWSDQSIVSAGEQTTFAKTSTSSFYCQKNPNITVAGGTYVFGATGTNVAFTLPTDFLAPDGGVLCGAGQPCQPLIYCAPLTANCAGENVAGDPTAFADMVQDMSLNCTPKH
jgi:hypothetical protein